MSFLVRDGATSAMMAPSSSYTVAMTAPSTSQQPMASTSSDRARRRMPVYFRYVPKDVWIRMHIDSRATVGSIKDAVLERLRIPPYDPSIHPSFFDETKALTHKQTLSPTEPRSFPRAFVARAPKRNAWEILQAEREAEQEGSSSLSGPSNEAQRSISPKKRTPRSSAKTAAQARAILGGDMGTCTRGSMGLMGIHTVSAALSRSQLYTSEQSRRRAIAPSIRSRPESDRMAPATADRAVMGGGEAADAVASFEKPLVRSREDSRPSTTPSDTRLANDLPSSSALGRRPSTTSHLEQSRGGDASGTPSAPRGYETADLDPTGLDAYADYYATGLPGNEEAKRLEKEAMASFAARGTTSNASEHNKVEAKEAAALPYPGVTASTSSNCQGVESIHGGQADDEDEGDNVDGERVYEELVTRSRSISTHSTTSEESLYVTGDLSNNDAMPPVPAIPQSDAGQQSALTPAEMERSRSSTSSRGARERARSGTIMASDVRKHKDAALRGSTTPSTVASSDMPVPDEESLRLPSVALPFPDVKQSAAVAAKDSGVVHDDEGNISAQGNTHRLAGIYTDEISSWKDAKHGQARSYTLHSFSNGNMLDDWRTMAAFRVRPFELFEIQLANPYEKVHLPRLGEAIDPIAARRANERREGPSSVSVSQRAPMPNPALDDRYLEPFGEAYCYIFRRGGGSAKAQKAGLGLWKLRYISIRGRKLSVFRRKPPRYAYEEEVINVWNLDAVDTVISERADGATRPALVPIVGLCQEILTLTFASQIIPPNSIHDEATAFQQASISMRFITEVDHRALFRTCARAHLHATLQHTDPWQAAMVFEWRRKALARAVTAGLGGTVIPGKASRRGGRNALARQRLRPIGVSRDFDDADRWSSESDCEDVPALTDTVSGSIATGVRPSGSNVSDTATAKFSYTDAVIAQANKEVPSSQPTPMGVGQSMPLRGEIDGDPVMRGGIGELTSTVSNLWSSSGPDTTVSADSDVAQSHVERIALGTSPNQAASVRSRAPTSPVGSTTSRRRGFTIGGAVASALGSGSDSLGITLVREASNEHRSPAIQQPAQMSSVAEHRIQIPATPNTPPQLPRVVTPIRRASIGTGGVGTNRMEASSTTGNPAEARTIITHDGGLESAFVLVPPSPRTQPQRRDRQRIPTNASSISSAHSSPSHAQRSTMSTHLHDSSPRLTTPSPHQHRPIPSSPLSAEEQSPAARAIHSFLAQRSASNTSLAGRERGQTNGSSDAASRRASPSQLEH